MAQFQQESLATSRGRARNRWPRTKSCQEPFSGRCRCRETVPDTFSVHLFCPLFCPGTSNDESYEFDDNGNRDFANGQFYVTGDDNQLARLDVAFGVSYGYAYDAEGNRTVRYLDNDGQGIYGAGDTQITEYTWDHRNRLTNVTYRDEYGGDATKTVEYVYDPFNRLIKREVDGDGNPGTTSDIEQTFYLYEMGQVVLQFDKTGSGNVEASDLSHRYLWGPAVDQLFADEQVDSLASAGATYWALTDHLGSVRDVVDNSGTLRIHRDYDSFGNLLADIHYNENGVEETDPQDAEYIDEMFGYTGRQLDDETGLQNNLNRWYDPATGRWISEDPLGFAAGDANLARYVGNEPTDFIDPSGLAGANGSGGSGGESWRERREKLDKLGFWDALWIGLWSPIRSFSQWRRGVALDRELDELRLRDAQAKMALDLGSDEGLRQLQQLQEDQRDRAEGEATVLAEGSVEFTAAGLGGAAVVRSMAARGSFLRSLADDYRTPSWMKPWLQKGKVPPGYEVDHIMPLSIGGADAPSNMRLQGIDLHRAHHRRYRPWDNR